MISYAQAREDVLLHRALHHISHTDGFYIDVGGYHPTHDSVTKHFYDHGWCGINVEPSEKLFSAFEHERPRDINLKAAVTDSPGEIMFHEIEGQLGTLVGEFADRHEAAGYSRRSYTVTAMTLAQICDQHARREIHFLKIDIEGHEASAIRGMDFKRFRPWIMVIESYEPNNLSVATYSEWEDLVFAAGYRLAYGDTLNRYYVAGEHSDLLRFFVQPVDDYLPGSVLRELDDLRKQRGELEFRIAELETRLDMHSPIPA
jgi:FkbM family methyltransferase